MLLTRRPEASQALERILQAEPGWMIQPDVAAQFRTESDAVNVAFEIAGFNRTEALAGYSVPLRPDHFRLDTMATVDEDAPIIDDLEIFPDWARIAHMRPAGRVFMHPATGRTLTVLHANKNPIEHTTGTDLVYFVHDYQSFIIVQYKVLKRHNNKLELRIDKRLASQEIRMAMLEASHYLTTSARLINDYRLANITCYFKLCEADQPREITDLSRGKYVDLATWRLMAEAGLLVGPRQGKRLLYESIERYLDNSTFAQLVSEGWVGSRAASFDLLLDYIAERYEEGKSLILGSLELGNSLRRNRTVAELISKPLGPRVGGW